MKANHAQLLEFLRAAKQLEVPIYQRLYSWGEKQCAQLWRDIMRVGGDPEESTHFIGSVVYIEPAATQTNPDPALVIDGQQRLATVTLLIEALARRVEIAGTAADFTPDGLRTSYLRYEDVRGARKHKLLMTDTDRATLRCILDGEQEPENPSLRVSENLKFFAEELERPNVDPGTVFRGLQRLMIVDVSLTRGVDNPQSIYDSLNSTGLDLSQTDRIRNFALMDLETGHQQRLYSAYWRPMEKLFGQENLQQHFDAFMRHYLTAKRGVIPKEGEVYEKFKDYAGAQDANGVDVDALLEDVHKFAKHYCAMAFGGEESAMLKAAFSDLVGDKDKLYMSVAYPLLLALYDDYAADILSEGDFERIVRLLEGYVFRRAVCEIPTNSLNTTFAGFARDIADKTRYVRSVHEQLSKLGGNRRFPGDEEFCASLQKRDLYKFRLCRYYLRKLELHLQHGEKERVDLSACSVEHIMPQDLSAEWKADLGDDWQRVHEQYKHSLGNLTLTGYNSEYSNRRFIEKRDMVNGFRESPIKLNRALRELGEWTEEEIKNRSEELAGVAVCVWPGALRLSEDKDAEAAAREESRKHWMTKRRKTHFHLLVGETFCANRYGERVDIVVLGEGEFRCKRTEKTYSSMNMAFAQAGMELSGRDNYPINPWTHARNEDGKTPDDIVGASANETKRIPEDWANAGADTETAGDFS